MRRVLDYDERLGAAANHYVARAPLHEIDDPFRHTDDGATVEDVEAKQARGEGDMPLRDGQGAT